MASKPAFEEVLRYVIETQGDTEIAAMARQILGLSDASDEARRTTAQLLDQFADSQKLARTAQAFRELGTEVIEVQQQYSQIQARVAALTDEMAKVEEPTKRQKQELATLSRQLNDTGSELTKLRTQWSEQRDTLEQAGISTQRYSTILGQVADVQRKVTAEIQDYAAGWLKAQQAQERAADFTGRLNKGLDQQGRATLDVAKDLKEYETRAKAAKDKTKDLGDEAQASAGIFDKLRTAAGAVFAYFTIDRVVDGIKSLVSEGSRGEQELAQLEAALASTGRQAEFSADQLDKMADGIARGLFDKGDITNAQTRLLTYTNIAGEQFPQALQVAIDQAQRLGISVESSSELIGRALQTPSKAMEALGRQGFILEASQKQLIKELEATGRTAEAQAVIMDMLVESYGGAAAAAQTNTILGLWERLRETWRDWQEDVANRGVLTYFKDQIRGILENTARLAEDGTLGRWAQQTADAIVRLTEFLKSSVSALYAHRDAIVFAAKAYAAFKIGGAILQMNQWRLALMAASREALANAAAVRGVGARATQLGTILKALPSALKIGVALVGVDLAIRYAEDLGNWLGKNSEAAEHLAQVQKQVADQQLAAAAGYSASARGLESYAHQTTLTAEQVAKLSDTERQGYQQRLEGLHQYLANLHLYYTAMKEAGALTPTMAKDWDAVLERLSAANAALRDVAAASDAAARGMSQGIPAAAQLIVDKLDGVGTSAKLAVGSIRELFAGLDFADDAALGNVALALANIAGESARADRNVRDGLLETVRQLSGEELLRFQSASQAAFSEFNTAPAQAAAILNTTLFAAMQRLGVSAERTGAAFSDMGRDAVASFGAVLENANATSAQIETAFRAALSRVGTLEEARALGALLQSAGEQGKLGFDAAARSAGALESRIRGITAAMDPLTDEFEALGIQSQASLNAAADAARSSFEAIRKGASQGKASIEDVRRAYEAYARTARAAVAESDATSKVRVESELAVLEAVYEVNDGLDEMTNAGRAAGNGVAAGAQEATQALQETAAAASSAAQATAATAEAGWEGRRGLYGAAQGAIALAAGFGELSDAAVRAYMATNQAISPLTGGGANIFFNGINEVTNRIREQRDALQQELTTLHETSRQFDAMDSRRQELSKKYSLLGASQIEGLLQAENEVDGKRKARMEAEEREREKQRQADLQRLSTLNDANRLANDAGAVRIPVSDNKLTVELVYPQPASGGEISVEERRTADRLLKYMLPKIVQELARSKAISVVQRPRLR